MNVEPATQRALLELAEVDAELARVRHRRSRMPERERLQQCEQQRVSMRDALTSAQLELSDADRSVARMERDVEQVRAREKRDEELVATSTNAKQVGEIQHDLDTARKRRELLEDSELELLEDREAKQTEVARLDSEVQRVDAETEQARSAEQQATAELDELERAAQQRRDEMLPQFGEELLADYERVREQKGIGAAPLTSRRCGACHLELNATALSKVRAAPADAVVNCEECGAILVRGAESGV